MARRSLAFILVTCLLLCLMCGCNAENKAPQVDGWKAESCTRQEIADGVEYMHLVYTDDYNRPHVVYVLTVDPAKAYLYNGTSDNSYDVIPLEKQNVMQHMQSSAADGLQVVAGVNGDFFGISSSFMPCGMCIKEGTVIRNNSSYRPFFATTYDGEYVISDGTTDKVDLTRLQTAVGGSHVILRDGKIDNVGGKDEFSTTPHPRTLSGVTSDGKYLLVVIDGRQASLSNGASLIMCARLMLALGAVNAINLDGGGSSTMIIKNGDNFETVNSPSDGSLRKVYNSVQVVIKP